MKRILLRTGLVLVGLAVAVWVTDRVLSALDPYGSLAQAENSRLYREEFVQIDLASDRLFRHKPDFELEMRGFELRTNELGLRNEPIVRPKPTDERRILFLGDSVTFGWGVDAEDAFCGQLPPLLHERFGGSWTAINAGHLLHDTTQEAAVLEELGEACEPDLVCVVFVDNDVVLTRQAQQASAKAKVPADEAAEPAEVDPSVAKLKAWNRRLLKIQEPLPGIHSVLSHWILKNSALEGMGSRAHAKAFGLSTDEGWVASSRALLQVQAWCQERGLPFVLLNTLPGGPLEEKVSKLAREHGIDYGIIAPTEEQRRQDIVNSPADAHPNRLGHTYLAEAILEVFATLGVADKL